MPVLRPRLVDRDSSALHAKNISGTKYGASTTVVYGTAVAYAADHGRHWDPTEGVAWTVYKRQNCTATYGCVNPWRELYYDDATALGLKYDLSTSYNLRGAGIWALGYDGTRTELYAVLKAKFITDKVPPVDLGVVAQPRHRLAQRRRSVRTRSRSGVTATGLIRYGWYRGQPLVNGVVGTAVRSGRRTGQSRRVHLGRHGRQAGAVVPDGPYRITVWAADASNNRAAAVRTVTVDRSPGRHVAARRPELHLARRRRPRTDDAVDGRRRRPSAGSRPASSIARRDRPALDVHRRTAGSLGLERATGATAAPSPTAVHVPGRGLGTGPATGRSATWSSGSTGRSASLTWSRSSFDPRGRPARTG